jgi:fluoroquinolone transport system permease protein
MGYVNMLKSLGKSDLLNTIRDPMLGWLILFPIIISLIVRFLVPELAKWVAPWVDIVPYYPMVMGVVIVFVPAMYGVLIGFLLLDERDDGILTAMKVMPVSMASYIAYRVSMPMAVGFVASLISLPIAGLVTVGPVYLVAVALVASMEAPLFALVFAVFAENKVQGFAIQKMLGAVMTAPLLAYLIDPKWEMVFWAFPSFWPIKAFWEAGIGGPNFWLYVAGAVIVHLVVIALLLWRFDRVMHKL